MKVPAGTSSGKIFKLRGKGIIDNRTGRRGDQHVRVYIHVPSNVSERERELLEQLANIQGTNVEPTEKSFLDKVKDFFDT